MSDTILVTGAAGFIGCRVTEILSATGWANVRAGVRRWSSAARLGRMTVPMIPCDVTDAGQVAAAMEGVSAVVHCAVGPPEVTVDGTRNVLAAAEASGVKRVVHLSTVDVYGGVDGTVNEACPIRRTGIPYGDSKVEAEEACREAMARGVPVTILRPSLVYGPFGANWTVMYADRLAGGEWYLPEQYCQGSCNLLYVDDLVQAILLAISNDAAIGEVFNVNGPGPQTWLEYFRALNDAMGLPPLRPAGPARSRLRASAMMPVRRAAKTVLKHFRKPVMGLAAKSIVVKEAMRGVERMIRQTPATKEFGLYGRTVVYDATRATEVLGYHPEFAMTDGVALTGAWLRHHGYGPQADVTIEPAPEAAVR